MGYISIHSNKNKELKRNILPTVKLDIFHPFLKKVYEMPIEKIELTPIDSTDYNKVITDFYQEFSNIQLYTPIKTIYQYKCVYFTLYASEDSPLVHILIKITNAMYKLFPNKPFAKIYVELNERKRVVHKLLSFKELNKLGLGFTTAGLTYNNNIIVTKRQEADKLLLHELFHLFDLQPPAESSFIRWVNDNWYTNSYNLYETHCELMSIIFHCLFLAIETALVNDIHDYNVVEQLFAHFIKVERNYSLLLIQKVLKLHDITPETFFNNNSKPLINDNIPAYTIARGILFYYLYQFTQLLNADLSLKFNYVKGCIDILEQIYKNDEFISKCHFYISEPHDVSYIAQILVVYNH